jgi:hypothetical protein
MKAMASSISYRVSTNLAAFTSSTSRALTPNGHAAAIYFCTQFAAILITVELNGTADVATA